MRHLSRGPDLIVELGETGGIPLQLGWQELQCDGLTQPEVVCAIDFTHPATAEEADDPVPLTQDRTRCKAPVIDRIRRREPAARWWTGTIGRRTDDRVGRRENGDLLDLRDGDRRPSRTAARRTKPRAVGQLAATCRATHRTILVLSEDLCPSDSPVHSLAHRSAGAC